MASPYRSVYTDLPGFRRACSASSSNDCWLCDVLPSWNSALRQCRLNLREEEPGKLCLQSLRATNPVEIKLRNDRTACYYAAFFLAYLPRQHQCIIRINLHRNVLPCQQIPNEPPLTDWKPESNVQYIEISGIFSLNWDALLGGLGRVRALKGLIIENAIIDDCFVSKLDQLLAENLGCLQKLAIFTSPTESAGISDRLISAISKCTLLTDLLLDGHLTTTGVEGLGRMLLSCKSIQRLSIREQFKYERSRALLGAVCSCVKMNASLKELRYESLSLDFIELLEALQFNCTLQHLVLSGCKHNQNTFGKQHGVALGKALANNCGLRNLMICHCNLSELAAEEVSTGLAFNSFLERFDLSHCTVGFYAMSTLCRALCTNHTLKMLVLDSDAGYLHERISFSTQLAAANSYSRVTMRWAESDMPNFANALKQPSLCPPECHIQSNGFSDRSFSEVCSVLASSTVMSLTVTFNDSGFTQARQMREAIQKNQSIVSLSLREDSISSGTCIIVAGALLENEMVTKLSLSVHNLSTDKARSLSEILYRNQTIEELSVNCIDVRKWRIDILSNGLKQNCTLTHFSLFDEKACACHSTIAVDECVDRNRINWNCAVQFVLAPCISRRRAQAFELLQGMPCFLQRIGVASGKSQAEAAVMVELAKHFIKNNYLFITGVVCQGIRCRPSREVQIDQLNSDCWLAITQYLNVSDVVSD